MPRYIKYCAICQKEFLASRVGATYCSKKCRSRSAKLPAHLLEMLIRGASTRQKTLDTVPKVVRDYLKNNPTLSALAVDENIKVGSLTPAEIDDLTKKAEQLKRQQEIDRLTKEFAEEDKIDFSAVDPEMKDFKLKEI